MHWNSQLSEVLGDEKGVHSIEIVTDEEMKKLELTGVFIAIGLQIEKADLKTIWCKWSSD